MRIDNVTSAQNPKIKELLALSEKPKLRREKACFVVEGRRELERCLDSGYIAQDLFICGEIIPAEDLDRLSSKAEQSNPRCGFIQIPAFLYQKIAFRGRTEGIVAEMCWKDKNLDNITLSENPLVMVLEGVEKPGNLGAVLRSADAAGADAVIICDTLTDTYNPNLIRASVGGIFTNQVAVTDNESALFWLRKHKFSILTAQLQDSSWYYDTDMKGTSAIVMGTESTGLTEFWRKAADRHIKIPMLGQEDSLNVSVSAAILLYEAVRQRNMGK